jgi:uncharacterized coiled-coil protein SlyX
VAETPDKETHKQPEAAPQVASSRAPAIAVSLAALAIIGAATANSLPSFDRFSLPDFPHFSLPNFDRFSSPDFSRFPLPNFNRVAAQPPQKTAPAPIPDPVVRAALLDIQVSQRQNAVVLESLTQSSATQQADLKRISRQLALLTAQVDSLQNSVTPLTTSSIPHSSSSIPQSNSGIALPNPRARVVRTARKVMPPPLPKPVGPVSVGGAPLSPAPAPNSGTS